MIEIKNNENTINNILLYTQNLMDKNKYKNYDIAKVIFSELFDSSFKTSPKLYIKEEELINLNIPKTRDFNIFNSLLSLRDQVLAETGKRIWGLTFTLYPDGKYEIEYDYNVPEGFNEKGEYIGEQNFGEITEFFDNIRNIGTDEFELK